MYIPNQNKELRSFMATQPRSGRENDVISRQFESEPGRGEGIMYQKTVYGVRNCLEIAQFAGLG